MFERFTEQAVKTVLLAQEESRRLKHDVVGSEQLLLGVLSVANGVSKDVLRVHKVTLKDARQDVENIRGKGHGRPPKEMPFTMNAQKVLDHAWTFAQVFSVDNVTVDHVFLGILATDCVATQVLKRLEANPQLLTEDMFTRMRRPDLVAKSTAMLLFGAPITSISQFRKEVGTIMTYLSKFAETLEDYDSECKASGKKPTKEDREAAQDLAAELELLETVLEQEGSNLRTTIAQLKNQLRNVQSPA